jgi:2-polyprenyl-3-methyl-5-hydroxy-6-metoxy-1,4-benzoquinol methylase
VTHGNPAQTDFRARIYQHYVHGRTEAYAPETLDGLRDRQPYVARVIRQHFPNDKAATILDLGCGYGPIVHLARQAGYTNVVGVDRSPEMVAEAKRLGIEGVVEGDLMETLRALPDESQDVVIAFDVIEHFDRHELMPLVDEVYRVLERGGRWLIHTPNAQSPFFGRIRYGDFTHEQAFTPTSMGQLLLSSGFSRLDCFEDAPIVHGAKSAARYVVWRAIRGLLRLYLAAETGTTDPNLVLSQNFLTVAVK